MSLTACVQSGPYRTAGIVDECSYNFAPCKTATIERFLEFDIAYVEFTQRGNIFDRSRSRQVIDYIENLAASDEGAAVFVFAHGWKHGASSNDKNVLAFREFLSRAAENPFVGKRRVVGVYLGWRGSVTKIPIVKELSYWGRKSVAEEIGSGGATEVLSELQHILVAQDTQDPAQNDIIYKNTFVVIGHSFGGAIVLTALHDVLLAKLIASHHRFDPSQMRFCEKINRFADGIILINPAVEANRAILLREVAARCRFGPDQAELMHVLGSEADTATTRYFPLGQSINLTNTLSPQSLKRTINGKQVSLSEHGLDVRTVGNYGPLRTAYLFYDQRHSRWRYARCGRDGVNCQIRNQKDQRNHIPVADNDPLVFLRTDKKFIKDHNDAFSCYVQAYITTVMFDTQSTDSGYQTAEAAGGDDPSTTKGAVANCMAKNFDFDRCFTNQLYDYNCDAAAN